MVDFITVKINRISDPVILQHLWNSIDDLNLSEIAPTKLNVIERCERAYAVEPTDINKNLFLALKEGTITRNVKTDILSRVIIKEDRSQGDWYCFLCHKCGPDTRCRKCDTSFHSSCNSDLFDQFHCHTCRQSGQFLSDFQKFSTTTQSQIIRRVIHSNKLKWKSLNIVGYINDEARNRFFLYKTINSLQIDANVSAGKYFSTTKNRENFLSDLLLLRHNCTVIYGVAHAFYKLISGYIKHLHIELENIYCDSCYILFSKSTSYKLNSAQKNDLFCSVCTVKHQIMWGLMPPNIFWPFKVISQDNERFLGIKFSCSIHLNRLKIESFPKETCLVWSSYNPQMSDRPSMELLKAYSMAQKYAQNLLEAQKDFNSTISTQNKKRRKSVNTVDSESDDFQVSMVKSKKNNSDKKINCTQKKVGRPPTKRKVGRPSLKSKTSKDQQKEMKELIDNLSSTDSSSNSLYNYPVKATKPKRPKKIADVFVSSDTEKSDRKTNNSIKRQCQRKTKRSIRNYSFLSSTDSESDLKVEKGKSSDIESRLHEDAVVRLDYINHQPIQMPSSVDSSQTSQRFSKYCRYAQQYDSSSSDNHFNDNDDSYSSDATVPQRLSPADRHYYKEFKRSHCRSESGTDSKHYSGKKSSKYRSQCDLPTSSKYSAYSRSSSRSSHYVANEFATTNESLKSIFKETNQGLIQTYKDGITNPTRTNNLETGLYCSSSSPINFSPMSTNQPVNVAQFSMQSTPSSNYQMSCDEISHGGNNLVMGSMKLNLKNRAFQISSPLQLGINVDPKMGKSSPIGIMKNQASSSNNNGNSANQNTLPSDSSSSDNEY